MSIHQASPSPDILSFSAHGRKLADGIPPDDYVVTRNLDGSPASRYGDHSWNIAAYGRNNRNTCFIFYLWKAGTLTQVHLNLINEVKFFTYLLLFHGNDISPAVGTIINKIDVLRKLARLAELKEISLTDALQSPDYLKEFINTCNPQAAGKLNGILRFIYETGFEFTGVVVPYHEFKTQLLKFARLGKDARKQTAPIPTRVYSDFLSHLGNEIESAEKIIDRLIPLLEKYIKARNSPSPSYFVKYVVDIPTLNISSELENCNLQDYFSNRGLSPTVNGLSRALLEILITTQLQIHAYTGMRINEVMSLPFKCWEDSVVDGVKHHLITGTITKLNKGKVKQVRWVTNSEGKRAVLLAQKIAYAVYVSHGTLPDPTSSKKSGLLYVSMGLGTTSKFNRIRSIHPSATANAGVLSRIMPNIIDEDLRELEKIDSLRVWRAESEYQVGKPWPFKSHQLRRSLALYAQRSGLVSLPSLKRQLQHITQEMALYYGRGSSFAKDLIGNDKEHFGREWQDSQAESQYLAYAAQVLFTVEPLQGGHGNWASIQRKKEGNLVWQDRTATFKRFKNGELAFKETVLGGCINTGTCESSALDVLDIKCLESGCKNMVVMLPKLKRAVSIQVKTVAAYKALDAHSVEYRTEQHYLMVLMATLTSFAKTNLSQGQ